VSASDEPTERGPWPEPAQGDDRVQPERRRPGADVDVEGPRWDEGARWDESAEVRGSKAVSVGVALLSVGYLMILPVLLAVGIYTFITVYAIVKAIDSGPDTADGAVVLIGVVGLVTFFVLLLGGGLWAIGRAADPKKRAR
jgi:hypothetical protein